MHGEGHLLGLREGELLFLKTEAETTPWKVGSLRSLCWDPHSDVYSIYLLSSFCESQLS